MAESRNPGQPARDGGLEVVLEAPIPDCLPVGSPTAVMCRGACFHRRDVVESVTILVDGVPHRPAASRMPRPDLFRSLHPRLDRAAERDQESLEDPELRSYRSGFWGTVPIPARVQPGEVELRVDAELANGAHASAPLGRIEVVEPSEPPRYEGPEAAREGGLIAVCMATFDPEVDLLRTQIATLRAQTDRRWMCLISDDCSARDRYEAIAAAVGRDPRFVLSRSARRRGFYRNFERALRMVPPEAELVALCDQDDRWYPDKLETLRGAIRGVELAYSDLRLVDPHGRLLAESLWERRPHQRPEPISLLLSNTIPGAASLFRRRVIEYALPFPEGPGWQFHDHWLGVAAAAIGDVAYVDRPLYDYVQHSGAVLRGRIARGPDPPADAGKWDRIDPRAPAPSRLMTRWRAAYFYAYQPLALWAHVLLERCATRLTRRKRRALRWLIAADRSLLAWLWLAIGGLRAPFTRSEVDATERLLCGAIVWRHLVAARAARRTRPSGSAPDASTPPFDPRLLESTRGVPRRL
jgi:glycosyltransferase involved in cell wall biosynthesis